MQVTAAMPSASAVYQHCLHADLSCAMEQYMLGVLTFLHHVLSGKQ